MAHSPYSLGLTLLQLIFFFVTAIAQNFPYASQIDRTGWRVTADSSEDGYDPSKAIDGNTNTFWHTKWNNGVAPLPHYLQIDMMKTYVVNGITYQPRQDGSNNGNIGQHTVTLSADGKTWTSPVALGMWLNDKTTKTSFFTITTARYVRLTALSEAQGANNAWSSAAEINVYSPDPRRDATTFTPVPKSQGQWGPTVDMPLVPASAAITANRVVVFWAAYRPDSFNNAGQGITQTVSWDPRQQQQVSAMTVSATHHDMFCPGISLDASGRIVVTGGNDSKKTSAYDPATGGAWTASAEMNTARGYQSSVTLGDGRIFTIGGSWSGGQGGKNGEIYNPATDAWTALPGADAARILTGDAQGVYRADNHAWLFAWKANSVFHAGPSKQMNWFNVSGVGSAADAGHRGSAPDQMCGVAVMYDAVAGQILTAGGSPSYQNSDATSLSHIITLPSSASGTAAVEQVAPMSLPRSFASAVVLPDGKVLVTGGQAHPQPFTDTTAALPSELFDPSTRRWSAVAPVAVPRTYHSVALLLPDARVVSAGGGLCGTGCAENHFDAQVYSPPYLFNRDGSDAARPRIVSVSPSSGSLRPGASFAITTDVACTSFSLVRYGSSTHTVNTDQRRVPLKPTTNGNGPSYTFVLPSDPGILVPGLWMLFAMNSAGVPSLAETIRIETKE